MEDMSIWRKQWLEADRIEKELWRPRPMVEKIARFLELRRTFAPRLRQTCELSRQERRDHLTELQSRLRRIALYHYGCPASHAESSPG